MKLLFSNDAFSLTNAISLGHAEKGRAKVRWQNEWIGVRSTVRDAPTGFQLLKNSSKYIFVYTVWTISSMLVLSHFSLSFLSPSLYLSRFQLNASICSENIINFIYMVNVVYSSLYSNSCIQRTKAECYPIPIPCCAVQLSHMSHLFTIHGQHRFDMTKNGSTGTESSAPLAPKIVSNDIRCSMISLYEK